MEKSRTRIGEGTYFCGGSSVWRDLGVRRRCRQQAERKKRFRGQTKTPLSSSFFFFCLCKKKKKLVSFLFFLFWNDRQPVQPAKLDSCNWRGRNFPFRWFAISKFEKKTSPPTYMEFHLNSNQWFDLILSDIVERKSNDYYSTVWKQGRKKNSWHASATTRPELLASDGPKKCRARGGPTQKRKWPSRPQMDRKKRRRVPIDEHNLSAILSIVPPLSLST